MFNKWLWFFSVPIAAFLGVGFVIIIKVAVPPLPTATPISSHLVVVGHSIRVGRLTFREVYDEKNHVRCYTVENYYNDGSGGVSCVKETVDVVKP